MSDKTPGQINCEAFENASDILGDPWELLPDWYKEAWEAGAQAVLNTQPCPHPFNDVIIEYDMKKKCERCGQKFE